MKLPCFTLHTVLLFELFYNHRVISVSFESIFLNRISKNRPIQNFVTWPKGKQKQEGISTHQCHEGEQGAEAKQTRTTFHTSHMWGEGGGHTALPEDTKESHVAG